jgi:transposase
MGSYRHELTAEQWAQVSPLLPSDRPRGAFQPLANRDVVDAILWILRSGAPWRDLPDRYPNWKSVHTRFLRWSKAGIWKRVLDAMAVDADDELAIIDSSIVRVHMDAVGGKKNGSEQVGRSRGGPTTKIHAVVDGLGNPTKIALTEGQTHDVTQAPEMLRESHGRWILADKAYDSDALIAELDSRGSTPVIPSRRGRRIARLHDRAMFKSRFLVEHFFARIKRCRRIATRYEKLSVTYLGMVLLACVLTWLA